jgi:PAS domain S-box-containing protein
MKGGHVIPEKRSSFHSLLKQGFDNTRQWFAKNTFSPYWLKGQWRHPFASYSMAVLLELCALLLTFLLARLFTSFVFPGALTFITVTFIALSWGAGPGLIATLLGALLINYAVIAPYFVWDVDGWDDVIELLLFIGVGIGIAVIASQTEKARRNAEQSRQDAEEFAASLQQAERVAAARASQLEATFEAITDMVLLYDKDGNVLYVNPAARDLYGVETRPEYYARAAHERLARYVVRNEQGQVLSREQWPVSRLLRGEVLQSGNAVDVIMHGPDGNDLHLSVTGAPVRDATGHILGTVMICHNVTERRQLERRTQDALEALLVMAETLVQVRSDSDGAGDNSDTNGVTQRLVELIRSVLACKRVSITALETDMKTLRSVAVVGISPEQEAQWRARATGFNLHERFARAELDPQFDHNDVVIVDMTRPPYSNGPNPFGIYVMLLAPMRVGNQLVGVLSLDYGELEHEYTQEEMALARVVAKLAALVLERERLVQERAQAQANELALREANRRMDEFLSIASHELRTPLTAIKGNVQLAQRRLNRMIQQKDIGSDGIVEKLDVVRNLLERAERQLRMQNRLVNDLLDVSRIQANKLEMKHELCDLATIVREAVREQQLVAESRSIQLRMETQEPVTVLADADRISQVVTNYLTNALKYSEAEQPVEVCVRVNGGEARVLVCDNGPGLSRSAQEHIWDRFYRVEGIAVQSGSGVGLGLGLHICRTIIEAQGGRVGVESEPGAGSTFWFTVPLASIESEV